MAYRIGRTGRHLRSTRITGLLHYYASIRPSAPHRYSLPRGSSTCGFSLHIGAAGSHVPHKSLIRARAAFMPVATWAGNRLPPDLVPSQRLELGFDDVPMLSTLHQRFTRVRLPESHLMESQLHLFQDRSPPQPLCRSSIWWFGTCPCRPIPRGLPSSLVQHGASGCHQRPPLAPSWRTVISIPNVVDLGQAR